MPVGSFWGKVVFFHACSGLVLPVQPVGYQVAVTVPPWQRKLAVTHYPHQPCLLGDTSCNLSHCYSQPLSLHGPRSFGVLGGYWLGWLPPMGDIP